jgi:hypothetical protein
MSEKTYVGKGKVVGKFGDLRISIRHGEVKPNDAGYVNLIVSEMKEADKFGNTHTVYIDTFVPDASKRNDSGEKPDLPF